MVGFESSDDAAVFRLGAADDPEAEAVVSTIDYFTPVVESPFDFGRIAAANALSDVYAMGAEPLFVLNVVGFPQGKLPLSVLADILRGGAAVCEEAGVAVLGGQSVDFDVPLYGMAVTGRVKVGKVRRNVGARPGDALVLTKPIGTGVLVSALRAQAIARESVLAFARKGDVVEKGAEAAAVASMARLNRDAARAAERFPVSAGTDVTGFGLAGHLETMLKGSGVAAEISVGAVPLLPGARRLAEAGYAPDGSRRNVKGLEGALRAEAGVSETDILLLCDAQTSGGLLLALPADSADALVGSLRESGDGAAARIGAVVAGEPGTIRVAL